MLFYNVHLHLWFFLIFKNDLFERERGRVSVSAHTSGRRGEATSRLPAEQGFPVGLGARSQDPKIMSWAKAELNQTHLWLFLWIWQQSHALCIWSAALVRRDESVAGCRAHSPGTQHPNHENDSVLRMGPKRPSFHSASRGLWNWHTQSFSPLPLFSLPMSSVGAEPGVCSSPPDQMLGGGKTLPEDFDFIRRTCGTRLLTCTPNLRTHTGNTTPPPSFSFLPVLHFHTSALQRSILCRWPAHQCLVPPSTSRVW